MKYFYSPGTSGFYIDVVNHIDTLPDDVIEISEELHSSLLADQENGRVIVLVDGNLTTVEFMPPPVTWDEIRVQRSRLLTASDWTQVLDVALSPDQVSAWRVYRQELRDLTDTYATPDEVVWPVSP
jgi:hypothetical protein